ncbi:MAG TPA: IS1182 family transposase [Gemmatimonadales bacterium]|nr:IS1182 family transposase [Gemmatimonadales bacterium]
MDKTFRAYSLDQRLLLPPDLREWLPDGDLALFISDVVDELDLAAIYSAYEGRDGRGQPPYHPAMMVKLLLYGYCTGVASSRKIEQATYRDVAFRVLAADQHPDHDSIAEFRRRHLEALAGLFVQGLQLCRAAGLVQLGHVALDGTKLKANASKHKAMSYARMEETQARLEGEVRVLLEQAEQVDAAEDAQYGQGRRGNELPAELARRESRLLKIRAAKMALEQDAKERAGQVAEMARAKLAAREQRVGSAKGAVPKVPDPEQARPEPTAQRNFTDPESRIMKDGASKEFVQAYNAQIAVDGHAQVIVACDVTQAAGDVEQFVPMLTQVTRHTGQSPTIVLADAGYFSEANLTAPELATIDCYVPPDRQKHGGERTRSRSRHPLSEQMRAKLQTAAGRAIYARRKTLPEPVFGQIKQARSFRRFWLRGVRKVRGEWALICLTHNLLKLFRARACPAPA